MTRFEAGRSDMERITKERLKELSTAWEDLSSSQKECGGIYWPEAIAMAGELLAYRESGALEALKDAREFIENQQLPCEEWARILDITVAAVAKLEAIGE